MSMSMNEDRDLKIVFVGPPGAGKSTAIKSLSDLPPVSTDVPASDESRLTTVAMDFGEITLDDGDVVRLYGIPGQDRFEFVWPLIADSALGAIFMVDARDAAALDILDGYLTSFADTVRAATCVLAITHADQINHSFDPGVFAQHLRSRGVSMPVVDIDPRQKKDVLYVLNALLELLQANTQGAVRNVA